MQKTQSCRTNAVTFFSIIPFKLDFTEKLCCPQKGEKYWQMGLPTSILI